jgi:hypothetical protein
MDQKPTLKLPSLIQRMARRRQDREDSKGVDKLFELDYMGSAEFEFGAINKALKAMRAAKNSKWRVRPIMALNMTCYHVGNPDDLSTAMQLFEDQLKPRDQRQGYTKEWTYIYETYFPDPKRRHLGPYHGWWAVDEDRESFVLFKDIKHAEDFLSVL